MLSQKSREYFKFGHLIYSKLKLIPVTSTAQLKFSNVSDNGETMELSREIFKVNPGYGKLKAIGAINFVIKAACHETYPNADRAIIKCYGPKEYENLDIVKTEFTESDPANLSVSSNNVHNKECFCEIEVPIKYNLEVILSNKANVHIEEMECDEVLVNTDQGNLTTKALKSHNITMNTNSGTISAKGALQGNLFVTANETEITAQRLQGISMNIKSKTLKMNVKSSYIDEGIISASKGDLLLNNLHGSTQFDILQGKLNITSFHGSIFASLGNVDTSIHLSTLVNNSEVKLDKGHLAVSVVKNPEYNVLISAPTIEAAKDVEGKIYSKDNFKSFSLTNTDKDPLIKFNVKKGSVNIKNQDWFSTLGIKI